MNRRCESDGEGGEILASLDERANPTRMIQVQRKAQRLAVSVAEYLGANRKAKIEESERRLVKKRQIEDNFQRMVAVARNRASTELAITQGMLKDLTREFLNPEYNGTDPLSVAGYLRIGDFELLGPTNDGRATNAINNPVSIPAVLPLLNRSNIVLRSAGNENYSDSHLNSWILNAFERTAPGQLAIYDHDPLLRGAIAPFVAIRSVAAEIVPDNSHTLDELLSELSSHIKRVSNQLSASARVLGDLHRNANRPLEVYRIVILRDFPASVTDQDLERLIVLMESGPRCGVSFLIGLGSTSRHSPQIEMLLTRASIVDVTGDTPVATAFQGKTPMPVQLAPAINPVVLEKRVELQVERLNAVELSTIDFFELHEPITMWSRSSADGISAIVGRSGLETLSVTLGDEKRQQHNVLVSGAVGQGKSTLLLTLIYSIAWQYSPQEVEMYLLDLKEGMSLAPLAPQPGTDESFLPHARVIGLDGDQGYGAAVLETLVAECRRRARIFHGQADNIARYRALNGSEVLPRIIVMVDEFHRLFTEDERASASALTSLNELSRQGRAFGIHLLLASQTLSGITGMLSKADGIFAQFPVRLALKNSQSESRVVLDPHNTAAADLRYRGQVVLNENFGSSESNRFGVVASAEPAAFLRLRTELCSHGSSAPPSIVFDGGRAARLTSQVALLKQLRNEASDEASELFGNARAIVGTSLEVYCGGVGPRLSKRGGSHLAVLGGAHHAEQRVGEINNTAELTTGPNVAVGVLLAAAIALALQHPSGNAEFVFLDLLNQRERNATNLNGVLEIICDFGCDAIRVKERNVTDAVAGLRDRIAERCDDDPHLYVVGLGLDRVSLTQKASSAFGESAADSLRSFVKIGCATNSHLLAWWESVAAHRDALGFDAYEHVANRLLLSLHQDEIREIIGPRETWTSRENRGLLKLGDDSQARVIVPMAPLSVREIRDLREVQWDQ